MVFNGIYVFRKFHPIATCLPVPGLPAAGGPVRRNAMEDGGWQAFYEIAKPFYNLL
jgi:hypothetical protein